MMMTKTLPLLFLDLKNRITALPKFQYTETLLPKGPASGRGLEHHKNTHPDGGRPRADGRSAEQCRRERKEKETGRGRKQRIASMDILPSPTPATANNSNNTNHKTHGPQRPQPPTQWTKKVCIETIRDGAATSRDWRHRSAMQRGSQRADQ